MKNKSGELYRIAYQCEEYKKSGCIGNCGACPFNVALYTRSINNATLLKTTAMMDNNKWHQREAAYQEQKFWTAIIYLGIFVFCCVWLYQCTHKKPAKVVQQQTQQYEQTAAQPSDPLSYPVIMPKGVHKPNSFTGPLHISLWVSRGVRDVTMDGLVNCQDYALIFFCMVGDPRRCRIIINENPNTGMNHLFVRYNGVTIEPASGMEMQYQWGKQYDPKYDEDVTEYWYFYRYNAG